MVKIAHSTIDERGKSSGGQLGDQTGKEVCTRNWYKGGWHTLLRPKRKSVAIKSAKAAEWIAEHNLDGYDQSNRNSLHKALLEVGYDYKKLDKKTESDCSAFVTACAICGGAIELDYEGNAPVTKTMVGYFTKSDEYEALKASKYLNGYAYLRRGDILVKEGHTVIVISDGKYAEPWKEDATPAPMETGCYSNAVSLILNKEFQVGRVYTLDCELRVRTGPGLGYHALTHGELTENAKAHDKDKDGALEAGTRVTCKEVWGVKDGYLWIRIPSGYIAAYKMSPARAYLK